MQMMQCCIRVIVFFFFKQKTAYEMRISDWSSYVCSSDLLVEHHARVGQPRQIGEAGGPAIERRAQFLAQPAQRLRMLRQQGEAPGQGIGGGLVPGKDHRLHLLADLAVGAVAAVVERSEEHTSELQSLMRISYAVFCLKKKKQI